MPATACCRRDPIGIAPQEILDRDNPSQGKYEEHAFDFGDAEADPRLLKSKCHIGSKA
jgi:hypothetical protein